MSGWQSDVAHFYRAHPYEIRTPNRTTTISTLTKEEAMRISEHYSRLGVPHIIRRHRRGVTR